MKYGEENSNYRHGRYSVAAPPTGDVRQAMAKDLLRRILTTPCDGRGELPFTREEQAWALAVIRERPAWAKDVLAAQGIQESGL